MLEAIGSISIGYLLGNLNPAAILAAKRKTDLREYGTKNLGATNVTLTFGFLRGFIVMLVDILKGFISVKLAKLLFPHIAAAGAIAGLGSVLGHVFPAFMHFRGGKGLAAFGGMILALDPFLFLVLLLLGIVLILVTDYPVALTFTAALLAPWLFLWKLKNLTIFCPLVLASGLILTKHWENVKKIRNGTEGRLSSFIEKRKKVKEH